MIFIVLALVVLLVCAGAVFTDRLPASQRRCIDPPVGASTPCTSSFPSWRVLVSLVRRHDWSAVVDPPP